MRVHTPCLVALVGALACAVPSPASARQAVSAGGAAESTVRVTKDRATIWTRNPSLVLAMAPAGTLLRAVAREGAWYEVDVPEALAARPGGDRGFILAAHVELVPGTPAPPVRSVEAGRAGRPAIDADRGTRASARSAPPAPALGIRGFGMVDYMTFAAKDSFRAILGQSSYALFGGGVEVVLHGRFVVGVSASRFRKTGQRVFVSGGDVYPLGLDDTVTITPVSFTGAYRFGTFDRVVPYAGGGAGFYTFKEEAEFAEPGEDVDERVTSYHALGGVEYAVTKWLFTGVEAQYTTVPDALGAQGVAVSFGEKNLGGFSLRVKVSVGR